MYSDKVMMHCIQLNDVSLHCFDMEQHLQMYHFTFSLEHDAKREFITRDPHLLPPLHVFEGGLKLGVLVHF